MESARAVLMFIVCSVDGAMLNMLAKQRKELLTDSRTISLI